MNRFMEHSKDIDKGERERVSGSYGENITVSNECVTGQRWTQLGGLNC